VCSEAAQTNASIWDGVYANGGGDLRYPSDILVRLAARLVGDMRDVQILDYGFGTGANLIHFAKQGHRVSGVEVSGHALTRTTERLRAAGLTGDLRLIRVGDTLPFDEASFDFVYAWQVIYYNDREGWSATVRELERVTRPAGRIVVATAAPGDISALEAEPLGNYMYRSKVAGQQGCVVTIPDRDALASMFPGRDPEIGEFNFRFGTIMSHHWIVSYRMSRS
jgi:SAM-dependent methyltransferase